MKNTVDSKCLISSLNDKDRERRTHMSGRLYICFIFFSRGESQKKNISNWMRAKRKKKSQRIAVFCSGRIREDYDGYMCMTRARLA